MLNNDFTIRVANRTELEDVKVIRRIVFTEEQNIPAALDNDGLDEKGIHGIIIHNKSHRIAASGRLYVEPTGKPAILARIAVLQEFRGQSLGKEIVHFLETVAKAKGATLVELHPHKYLYKFYSNLGYRLAHTEEATVAGHTLLTMVKNL